MAIALTVPPSTRIVRSVATRVQWIARRDKGSAIFVCLTKEGKEFSVRPMGTLAERTEYFVNFKKYKGKQLTVEFEAYTPDDKIPFQPVGLGIREIL